MFAAVAIGTAIVGAGATIISGSKAAGAAKDTAAQNNALQSQIYGENKATLAPYVNAGIPATNSIQALLGLGGGSNFTPGGFNADAYLQANPDVAEGFKTQSRFRTPQEYAQFHFDRYGRDEGRGSVTTGGQTSKEAATAAFDQFRGSTGYDFRVGEGNKALTAALGKNSMLDSGAAVKSAIKYNQNVGSDEFARYLGALQGQQALGAGAASAQAGVATNFANATSANNNNASAGQQSAYLNTGNAINGALSNGVSAFAMNAGLKSSYGGGGTYI